MNRGPGLAARNLHARCQNLPRSWDPLGSAFPENVHAYKVEAYRQAHGGTSHGDTNVLTD